MTQLLIRWLDFLLSAILLLALSPLLALICVAVFLDLGHPVLFRQVRAGQDNRPFRIIKFRTMHNLSGGNASLQSDEARLTVLGRFLRKSSLDELPELFNVLKGEMSLVGPRPLFLEYYPFYTPRERKRLSIRPGITGLAQISGRNYLGWDKKLGLDATYAENLSIGLYLKILFATPFALFDWGQVAENPWTAEQPLDIERSHINPSNTDTTQTIMANQDPSRSAYWKDHFSRLMGNQDLSNTHKLDFSNDRVRFQTYSWILESIGPIDGLHCLDVGCGTGDLARIMRTLGGRVDAFDLAEPAITELRERHPDIRWLVADATDLVSAEIGTTYDAIVASEVLQHVDAPATLCSLWERLAPGGRLAAVMPNDDCPIVKRTRERFSGHYGGIDIEMLCDTLSNLPNVTLYRWRGAFFLEDQRLFPYGLSPWFGQSHDFGDSPPNRLQFVALKSK